MTTDPRRVAVLALHWQVNVIEPEGFFGGMLAEPVLRSGVVARAARFHAAVREAGLPVYFTRFTIPLGGGQLVRNTGFMEAVDEAQELFRPDARGAGLVDAMRPLAEPGYVIDNQKLSGLAGNDLPSLLSERGVDTVYVTGVATNLPAAFDAVFTGADIRIIRTPVRAPRARSQNASSAPCAGNASTNS